MYEGRRKRMKETLRKKRSAEGFLGADKKESREKREIIKRRRIKGNEEELLG